jgi:glycosyltransferase involved in cell wall biosynthesis
VTEVHVIVPEGIDDPTRPSGGNTYDLRLCDALAALGWAVRRHIAIDLRRVLTRIPDGAIVLLDGLIASPAPEVLVPEAGRLRQVVLVHMPFEDAREREVLEAASGVITTSEWARRRLEALYALPDVFVAEPGVDPAALAPGNGDGGALLCVAAVTRGKGHDVLLGGLSRVTDLSWSCACVGSLDRAPAFADHVRRRALADGLRDRVHFAGPRAGAALDRAYAAADLLVLASHGETYGMVVTEALVRGLPVIASDVGGIPEALGFGADGTRPGLLVPPGNAGALGLALRRWLEDAELRDRLRQAARERRETLRPWVATASAVSAALVAAGGKRQDPAEVPAEAAA